MVTSPVYCRYITSSWCTYYLMKTHQCMWRTQLQWFQVFLSWLHTAVDRITTVLEQIPNVKSVGAYILRENLLFFYCNHVFLGVKCMCNTGTRPLVEHIVVEGASKGCLNNSVQHMLRVHNVSVTSSLENHFVWYVTDKLCMCKCCTRVCLVTTRLVYNRG